MGADVAGCHVSKTMEKLTQLQVSVRWITDIRKKKETIDAKILMISNDPSVVCTLLATIFQITKTLGTIILKILKVVYCGRSINCTHTLE